MRAWLLTGLLLVSAQVNALCQDTTESLDAMSVGELTLKGPGERSLTLTVRVADDSSERAAGFQHVCPDTIDTTNIYFQFDSVRRPAFHMHNVWAPLDIAFIDDEGLIVDIQRMEPYVLGAAKPVYYSPPGPVAAALEARAGYFAGQRVTAGSWRVERLQR